MAYIGKSIESGTFSVLDTSGNTYNGSNTTFNLGSQVGSPAQLLVSHDGVIQKPGTDYTLASGGTQITFTTAPASGASIFIVEISGAVGGPLDADLNGTELILDADGDTSLHASTDDQIDVKIAGADDFKFTANTFTAQSGSSIVVPDGGLTFGSTAITSTAAELNIVDGNTSATSTTIADADRVVLNDNGTMVQAAVTDLKTYIGGGTLVKTGQTTLSSNSSITLDNCFTSDYETYVMILSDINATTDDQTLQLRFRTGGSSGSTDTASQYRYACRYFDDDGGLSSNTGVDQNSIRIADGSEESAAWKGYNGTFTVYQPQLNTSTRMTGHGSFVRNTASDEDVVASYNAMHYDSDAQHTGIFLYYSSGDIRSGAKVIVYGVSEA
jgi:hypothetical protein